MNKTMKDVAQPLPVKEPVNCPLGSYFQELTPDEIKNISGAPQVENEPEPN